MSWLFLPAGYATGTETGFAVGIAVFSATAALATSPRCTGKLRARSFGPIKCLYLDMATSWFLLPFHRVAIPAGTGCEAA